MIFTRSILETLLPLENISNEAICNSLNKIGLEVESFREISAPKKVVVGKILECSKHPNADKLNVTKVAIGGDSDNYEIRQIVCGAQNARAGIFVAVALEGAILPEVTIKKATLRGVESCGMLCSTSELGFPKINDGIVELDSSIGELVIGKELNLYPTFNDAVFEISITPNRGDCMSLLGISRDLSVAFNLERKPLKLVKEAENAPGIGRVLQIISSEKRDASLQFRAIETRPSATLLQVQLFLAYNESLSGNWLKDALNFAMLYTGVLLNAYPQSFCQLDGEKVVLHIKKDSLGFDSVYQGDLKLSTIGINAQEHKKEYMVESKEFIILEASYISPEIIAQKVLDTKIKVDAKTFQRASRGSYTNLEFGLLTLAGLLLKNDGILYTDVQELIEIPQKVPIATSISMLEKIIGVQLEKLQVVTILKGLEFKVELGNEDDLILVTPPQFRHDIVGFQDVAEEIIRFFGIDNVPSTPLGFLQQNQANDDSRLYFFRRNLVQKAISVGFSEVVHFVFEEKEQLEKYGFAVLKDELDVLNPITNELNTLRSTLLLGLLRAAQRNFNNGFSAISLCEMGAVYDENRTQGLKMAFIQSGLLKEERFPSVKGVKGEFFDFCDRISSVIGAFECEPLDSDVKIFHKGQCAKILQNGKNLGVIASLHPLVADELDLPSTFICEIDAEKLESYLPQVKAVSKFQKVERDLSVLVDKTIPYFKIKEYIASLQILNIVGFYPLDVYYDDSLGSKHSLTIRFILQSMDKTLDEKEISSAIDGILEALKRKFSVELR
ncbi:MAG: phenylalanine--tRNA ligase subunit beta [Helicobacter sp.]|nr:phenylalanine--tRNA ligase subunit beta [Helicobacter sp.]